MNTDKNIIESINCYTYSSQDCEILKILMSPIEYLGQLKNSNKINPNNQANINLCNLISNLTNDESFRLEFNQNVLNHAIPKTFIKTSSDLYSYLKHIQNILLQSYINYYDQSKNIPLKLYRSVSSLELEYLKNTRQINTLWSTTSTLDSVIGYTLEIAEHEWDPKEHFIIELAIKNKIPFVDVDNDAKTIFEPNEFILTPPFTVSKLKLVKKGGMNPLGFYNQNSIPIYSAELKTSYDYNSINNVAYDEIINKYNQIAKDIKVYGNMIEAYLNNNDKNNLLHNQGYRLWARNLQELIKMMQLYMNEYAKEFIKNNNVKPKMKILK